jgi:hypothetical protein
MLFPNDSTATVALPEPIGAFVQAANSWNLARLVSAFADDALVNDQLQDYWGKREIEVWAARDIIGERLVMKVVHQRQHHDHVILTTNVDGNYDKRGLPDPLVLVFYFSVMDGEITQLIILRNRSGT